MASNLLTATIVGQEITDLEINVTYMLKLDSEVFTIVYGIDEFNIDTSIPFRISSLSYVFFGMRLL